MDDKFKDIEVGDKVYTVDTVRINWGSEQRFYVPAIVERITPTQFVLDNGKRYKKDRGSCIGGEYFENAYYPNDNISGWG